LVGTIPVNDVILLEKQCVSSSHNYRLLFCVFSAKKCDTIYRLTMNPFYSIIGLGLARALGTLARYGAGVGRNEESAQMQSVPFLTVIS
jgi:hypothetical protein